MGAETKAAWNELQPDDVIVSGHSDGPGMFTVRRDGRLHPDEVVRMGSADMPGPVVAAPLDPVTEEAHILDATELQPGDVFVGPDLFDGYIVRRVQPAPEPEPADEATSLAYWLAAQMGEHVDDQDGETLVDTVQRYVSREWMPKTGVNPDAAPEPEPEWKDGQIGDALVHGASVRGFISNGGESFVFSVPGGGYHEAGYGSFEDFVPLVVLDPADVDVVAVAKAMHQVDYPGLDFALNLDQSVYVAKARAALAHLGIEATR